MKQGRDKTVIIDGDDQIVGFFPDVPRILSHLQTHDQVEAVVSASRTHAPRIAEKMLKLIHVPHEGQLVPSADLFDHKVWGIGSKVAHFQNIQRLTGIEYKDMVFFDDEMRNRDVERHLGVTFVPIDDSIGLTWSVFEAGISRWRERQKNNF